MSWHKSLAEQLSRHSDALAVIRAGRKAKRRTSRRARRRAALELLAEMDQIYGPVSEADLERVRELWPPTAPVDVDAILDSLGPEFDDPGDDPWGGANLEPPQR